jgi:hypothetical protein
MPIIGIYEKHTPRELRDDLMEGIASGDAHELHNALIVVCDLLVGQQREIEELKTSVEILKQIVVVKG